jgi:hypothetical protein
MKRKIDEREKVCVV